MNQDTASTIATTSSAPSQRTVTRRLLVCGVAAGPFFVAVGLIQAFTIPGV